jgi:sporulation protein YlmC with PRC-barrel domain
MFCCANRVEGYSVHALGQQVGEVKDLLFDDLSWIIRYLVVDTSDRIPKGQVLLLMLSIAQIDWENEQIPVNLTVEDVIKSPDIEARLPVSRQKELELYNYYGRSPYWGAGFSLGAQAIADIIIAQDETFLEKLKEEEQDSHLRSLQEVTGYQLISNGEEIGTVSDFFVESSNWIIRYLIIDMIDGGSKKQILFSPQWIHEISWADQKMRTHISPHLIFSAPPYDPDYIVMRPFEDALYQHFNQPAYWL